MLRYLKKKVHGLARSPNFENGIAPPLGVLGQKFFGVLNNSLGGTSGPSMSKIGDVRVPNHFDPCWNCPDMYVFKMCRIYESRYVTRDAVPIIEHSMA